VLHSEFIVATKASLRKVSEKNNRFFASKFMKIAEYTMGAERRERKLYTATLSPTKNPRDEQYVLLSQNNFPFISFERKASEVVIPPHFLSNEAAVSMNSEAFVW
jgi:hypothetical protein